MKDVIKNKAREKDDFYRLLEKICKDFNINNSEKIIKNFIKKNKSFVHILSTKNKFY